MTVLEVIHKSTDFLARKGIEHPRLHIELMLASILKLPRLQLYLNFDRPLAVAELDRLREQVRRRAQREPLQHILGTTSFCGFEIRVDRRVLVPRPETELLAERGWLYLNTLAHSPQPVLIPQALDFGTGSGCLAIAIALQSPNARITALDVSQDALDLARANAALHNLEDRILFVRTEPGADLPAHPSRFDLIIANPPYIPTSDIASLMPEVRCFDPAVALDGGVDGLNCYRQLAVAAHARLSPKGLLLLEVGDGQASRVATLLQSHDWVVDSPILDYNLVPRIVSARPAPGTRTAIR